MTCELKGDCSNECAGCEANELTEAEQKLSDEATTFVLAGCMISTLQLSAAKDKQGFVNILGNVARVLKADPDFIKRFQVLQESVMAEYNNVAAEKQKGLIQ